MNVWRGSSIVTPCSSQWRLVRDRSSRSASASCQRSLTPWVSPAGACTQPMRWPISASTDDDVGEVVLALRVVGGELAQRGPEQVATERVDARADLVDVEFVGRGVAVFDDPLRLAVVLADDAAVAGRVVDDAREQRGRVAVGDVGLDEVGERLGPQQRRVAGEDDDGRVVVVVVVAGERGHPDRRGVAGAVLLDLLDEGDVRPRRRELLHLLGHLLGAVADDERGAIGPQQFERVDDVQHHRPAADQVEWLGAVGPHARALAGGEHDRQRICSLMAPGRGIEPLFSAPKTAVLPLDDPGRSTRRHRISRVASVATTDSVATLMGSLIKKRRKRMRKKKHKKMLRRTRHQRRK